MKKILISFILVSILCFGCLKPPKVEVNEIIETNETAFLVPLEGKSKEGQGKFMSIDYLEEAKIATKTSGKAFPAIHQYDLVNNFESKEG